DPKTDQITFQPGGNRNEPTDITYGRLCPVPAAVARRAAAGAAAITRQRQEHESLAGHADSELPDRRDRPAPDCLAESEAGQRMDARQTDRMGLAECAP